MDSKSVADIKGLLNKMHLSNKGTRKTLVNRLIECKPVQQSGGGGGVGDNIIYGGGITQRFLNEHHRGWGFSFLG